MRGIAQPRPTKADNTDVEASIGDAVNIIGQRLLAAEPEKFRKRVSITSYTNRFSIPTDCDRILRIWDLGDNALTVSGAADNGSGAIRLTLFSAHGLADGDIVTVHDVGGCTEANGTWAVEDAPSTTTIDLEGSTFTNAHTSGGKAFKEDENFDPIVRMSSRESTGLNTYKWFLDGSYVVIDDPEYTNDIVMNYRYVLSSTIATALEEIPAKFHFGIVAYGVLDLITIPEKTDAKFQRLIASQKRQAEQWALAFEMINDYKVSKESKSLSDVKRLKKRI